MKFQNKILLTLFFISIANCSGQHSNNLNHSDKLITDFCHNLEVSIHAYGDSIQKYKDAVENNELSLSEALSFLNAKHWNNNLLTESFNLCANQAITKDNQNEIKNKQDEFSKLTFNMQDQMKLQKNLTEIKNNNDQMLSLLQSLNKKN